MDLEGILVSLQIRNYQIASQTDMYDSWCDVDFSFVSEPWLQYEKSNDEILLSDEIDSLTIIFEKLLADQITEPTEFACTEPDFQFLFYPKYDIREKIKGAYVEPGYEMVDIHAEWEVFFWHDGLTANHLSLFLNRKDIECLLVYFQLISGRITIENSVVRELIEKHIIICDEAEP